MTDLYLRRDHALGQTAARRVARHWAERMVERYGMECRYEESAVADEADVLHFTGTGVTGTLEVAAESFVLDAKLGLLLSVFQDRIAEEARQALDAMAVDGLPLAAAAAAPLPPAA